MLGRRCFALLAGLVLSVVACVATVGASTASGPRRIVSLNLALQHCSCDRTSFPHLEVVRALGVPF